MLRGRYVCAHAIGMQNAGGRKLLRNPAGLLLLLLLLFFLSFGDESDIEKHVCMHPPTSFFFFFFFHIWRGKRRGGRGRVHRERVA